MCYLSYSVQNLQRENLVKCPGQFRSIYFIPGWCRPQLVNPNDLTSVVSSSSVCYLSFSVQNLQRENVVKCPGQFRSIYFIPSWCRPQLINPNDLTSVVSPSSVCYLSYSVQNLQRENVVKCPGQFRSIYFIPGWCRPQLVNPNDLTSVVSPSSVCYLSYSVQNLQRENLVKCPGQFRSIYFIPDWCRPQLVNPNDLTSVVSPSSVCYLSYSVQNLQRENLVKCPGQFRSIYFIPSWCRPQLVNPNDLTSVVSPSSVCYLSYSVQNLLILNVVKCPGQFRSIYFISGWCRPQLVLQFI